MDSAIDLLGALEQRRQRRQYVAGEVLPDLVPWFFDVSLELILRRGAAVRCLQLLAQVLRRENAVVERRGDVAELLSDGDLVGLRCIAADEQRDQLALVLAWLCRGRLRHWRPARCLQAHCHTWRGTAGECSVCCDCGATSG